MSTNDRYLPRVAGFTDGAFYTGAQVAPFNQLSNGGLAAFVLFIIRGEYQEIGDVDAVPHWLWGNLDAANNTGWGLHLVNGVPQPVIRASFGVGTGILTLDYNALTEEAPGCIERLILAALWWNGSTYALTVNGGLFAQVDEPLSPIVASALAPRLGALPGAAPADGAQFVDVVAAGYGLPPAVNLATNSRTIGEIAASHFRSARAGLYGGQLNDFGTFDWLHRYEAQSFGGLQGTITKSARGAFVSGLPPAPASWSDVGGDVPLQTPSPVPLVRTGSLAVSSCKNPDWFAGASPVWLGAPPPP